LILKHYIFTFSGLLLSLTFSITLNCDALLSKSGGEKKETFETNLGTLL